MSAERREAFSPFLYRYLCFTFSVPKPNPFPPLLRLMRLQGRATDASSQTGTRRGDGRRLWRVQPPFHPRKRGLFGVGCFKIRQGSAVPPLSLLHRPQQRSMPPPPSSPRQFVSDFWWLFRACLFTVPLATSASNFNPISLLSTCAPSPSFSWSTPPSAPPSLSVEISSICPWQCDAALPPSSHLHPHGVLLSLSASISSPHSCNSNQNCQNDQDSVFVTAEASTPPPPPHVPVSCSALSLPVNFILTLPPHSPPLRLSAIPPPPTPSLITLCISGRSLAPPHNVTFLPPCISTTLPPPAPPPPIPFPPLLVCSTHPSYACNPVSFFVSQGAGAAGGGVSQTTAQTKANSNTDGIVSHLKTQSEFEIAFQVGRGSVTGCARLLLLPPPPHTHHSASPTPLFASSDLHLPAKETQFPFRFVLNVSLQLQAPQFGADGATKFCVPAAQALLHDVMGCLLYFCTRWSLKHCASFLYFKPCSFDPLHHSILPPPPPLLQLSLQLSAATKRTNSSNISTAMMIITTPRYLRLPSLPLSPSLT
jgi:hypothetical protein